MVAEPLYLWMDVPDHLTSVWQHLREWAVWIAWHVRGYAMSAVRQDPAAQGSSKLIRSGCGTYIARGKPKLLQLLAAQFYSIMKAPTERRISVDHGATFSSHGCGIGTGKPRNIILKSTAEASQLAYREFAGRLQYLPFTR